MTFQPDFHHEISMLNGLYSRQKSTRGRSASQKWREMPATHVTIDSCDREPIHIPGHIQDYGYFVSVDHNFQIQHYSSNFPPLVEKENPLGMNLSHFFRKEFQEEVEKFFSGRGKSEKYCIVHLDREDGELPCIAHQTSTGYIFEIGKSFLEQSDKNFLLRSVGRILAVIAEESQFNSLLSKVTLELKELLQIDRVMMYRFDEDWHGQVICEEKESKLESFLGLHFPASDIPSQARTLYTKNWLRVIEDVDYRPLPILPACDANSKEPLDLSDSILRSVSPIHIEYLKNMGVRATVVMSLMVEGKLWGLVACHHYSRLKMTLDARYICELLAKILSGKIEAHLGLEEKKLVLQKREFLTQIKINVLRRQSVSQALLDENLGALDIIDADGAVVINRDVIKSTGEVPDRKFLRKLKKWIDTSVEDIYASHCFGNEVDFDVPESSAGVMIFRVSEFSDIYVVWFRKERIHEVRWAGDPDNKVLFDPDTMKLSPRRSFAEFKSMVRGECRKWQDSDFQIIEHLRVYLLEYYSYRQKHLEKLVREKTKRLQESLQEVEESKSLVEQSLQLKSHLLASMAHEVKTPLNGILGLAHYLRVKAADEETRKYVELIEKSGHRLNKTLTSILELAEIESQKKTIIKSDCNVVKIVQEVISILEVSAVQKGLTLEFISDTDQEVVSADENMLIQVFFNILSNAIKYTKHGHVQMKVTKKDLDGVLYIMVQCIDTGIGISEEFQQRIFEPFLQESMGKSRLYEGVGLGLSITKKYLDLLGGLILIHSKKNEGSNFEVLLPTSLP